MDATFVFGQNPPLFESGRHPQARGEEDKSETRVLFVTVVNKPEKMTMWFCVFGLDNIIYTYITYRVPAMLNADGVGWGG